MEKKQKIVLVGGGMLASLLYEMFRESHDFIGYVDDVYDQGHVEKAHGLRHLGNSGSLAGLCGPEIFGIIAITDVQARRKYAELAAEIRLPLATLVADTAIVSESASLGPGCIIRHRAIISSRAGIGENCVISDNAYVGHDSSIGNNVYVSPAAALNGCVSIGDNSFLGTGAVVLPRVKVGTECVVAASACVTRDVADRMRVGGVPAGPLDPLVSVTLASYNHEPYVGEAIQSVLDQTYPHFELIISDDASEDGTPDEIRRFSDSRIHTNFFNRNQGIILNKRRCLEMAKGEFIAILNSDDAYLPEKLEKQVDYLRNHAETGAILTGVAVVDESGEALRDSTDFYYRIFEQPNRTRREWLRHFFHTGNCLCISSALIRRECYEKIGFPDKRLHQLPDWDFWIRLCFHYEIHIIPEVLTRFRVLDDRRNASGIRSETEIRTYWEFMYVLRNYLKVTTLEELRMVFPESEEITGRAACLSDDLVPFVLAQLALQKDDDRWRLFGLQVLFEIMGSENMAEKLEKSFGFTYRELIRLTGSLDMFHLTDRNHQGKG